LLYLLAISSLGIYGIVLAGWSSNSRYAFMGAIRSAAQMISYEITMGFVLLGVCLCSGSLNLTSIVATQSLISTWFVLPLYPLCIIFFISILAETNRAPFDLPEAEAELVSGYNTEYSSVTFALFFLGEYSNMLLMSSLWVILFWGGWDSGYLYIPEVISFSFKVTLAAYLFILVRAILPRYRYDKLLELGWKVFLPLTMGFLFFLLGILVFFDSLLFSSELLISSDLTSVKFF
jgi:NADH-quinone oxidoreductase subunit H